MSACVLWIPKGLRCSPAESCRVLQEKRPTVSPKSGFIGQLLSLEEQLGIEPASPRTAEASH